MKLGVPWSVKGIRPEARETARAAARRSGMSLGEWLNSVILHSAAEEDFTDDDDSEDVAAVHAKLDDLTRRIDRLAKTARQESQAFVPAPPSLPAAPVFVAPAPPHYVAPQPSYFAASAPPAAAPVPAAVQAYAPPPRTPHPAQAYAPPPPAAPPWAARFENAAAEIAARRRELNSELSKPVTPPLPPAPAPAAAPAMQQPAPDVPVFQAPMFQAPATAQDDAPMPSIVTRRSTPAQDLSGLEEQLRQITNRIDTLCTPGVAEAIHALRSELAEIGHSLNDAVPRRTIDTIEHEIQTLSQRVAEGRQAGVDGNALAGIEQGLVEVRDALYRLMPAENLVGFNDAIDGLSQKIDMIVAERDPSSLVQLENAVNTLRQIAAHIASDEAVSRVASDVAMLTEKIDHLAHAGTGDALSGLEERISALADALAQRSQDGINVPPQLETLVHSLSDKIEYLQNSRNDDVAFGALEDRIVKLVEKLDASDSRLAHLEAVERGLGDLLVRMSELRSQAGEPGRLHETTGGVETLKSDLARTQNKIEAVHGTLGEVVDRLATIERNMFIVTHEEAGHPLNTLPDRAVAHAMPAEDLAAPVSAHVFDDAPHVQTADDEPPAYRPQHLGPAPQLPPSMTSPPLAPAAAPAPIKPPMRARHAPIAPNLPPDQPIEPGAGPLQTRADAASRIAASEAALGLSMPQPADAPQSKSGFIAAARRAAQAALTDTSTRSAPRIASVSPGFDRPHRSPSGGLRKRMKSLLVAGSVIVLVIASVQFGAKYFGVSIPRAADIKHAPVKPKNNGQNESKGEKQSAIDTGEIETGKVDTDRTADNRVAPAIPMPGMIPEPSQYGYLGPSSPLMTASPLTPHSDVTGSVAAQPQREASAPVPAVSAPQTVPSDDLPAAIGGPNLRKAAAGGDAGAAFEVAMRYAEGRGVAANPAEAIRWFERAAAKGLAAAQFRLGTLYEKGQGVRKDPDKARQYYLAAATQGNAKAMHNLAVLYSEGIAGKPDFKSATAWFEKAAEHGVGDSQYNLAVLYARGLGVEKNLISSYKWFALAANQGDKEAAHKRDEVATHLDAGELAAAKKAVASFHPLKEPAAAVKVPKPASGWDAATEQPHGKTSTPLTVSQR